MRRIHFTIAQSMAAVLVIALAFAALRNADAFWASAIYTLAIAMLAAAVVGAIARKGRRRMTFAAFAVFGWAYLLVSRLHFGPPHASTLLLEWSINAMEPYICPTAPGSTYAYYVQISHSFGIVLFASMGAILGHFLAAKDDSPAA